MIHKPLGQETILMLKRSGRTGERFNIKRNGGIHGRLHPVEGPAEVDGGWPRCTQVSDGSGEVITGACSQNNPPGRRDTDRGCTTHSHGGNRFSNLLPTVQVHEDHSTG